MTVKSNVKGVSTPAITLESITEQFKPLVLEASNNFESYDAKCLRMAELEVDLRQINEFEGRKARKNELEHPDLSAEFKKNGVPAGVDWRGESSDYKQARKLLWDTALLPIMDKVGVWEVRTGKSKSDYPMVKNVDYYVENVLRERMGAELVSRYGLVPGTRSERAKRAAEKRQQQGNGNGTTTTNSTVDGGKPVPAILLTQADSLTKGLEAALKHPLPMHIAFELIQKLKALTAVADQYQEAVLSPPVSKAS